MRCDTNINFYLSLDKLKKKKIVRVIFLIVLRFLRYSLTHSSLNLPSKLSSITRYELLSQSKLPNILKASQPAASQRPATSQLASRQSASETEQHLLFI